MNHRSKTFKDNKPQKYISVTIIQDSRLEPPSSRNSPRQWTQREKRKAPATHSLGSLGNMELFLGHKHANLPKKVEGGKILAEGADVHTEHTEQRWASWNMCRKMIRKKKPKRKSPAFQWKASAHSTKGSSRKGDQDAGTELTLWIHSISVQENTPDYPKQHDTDQPHKERKPTLRSKVPDS